MKEEILPEEREEWFPLPEPEHSQARYQNTKINSREHSPPLASMILISYAEEVG